MAQRSTPIHIPEEEEIVADAAPGCCHHWVIQPADGPISSGSCQVCGEIREFKNYVESATWGEVRAAGKGGSATSATPSTSDDEQSGDEDPGSHDLVDEEAEPNIEPDDSDLESEE